MRPNNLAELKPSGVAQKMRLLRLLKRWMPALGDTPVSDVREADILKFINDLFAGRTNGHTEADHLVGVVRNVFTWAKKQHDPVLHAMLFSRKSERGLSRPSGRAAPMSCRAASSAGVAIDPIHDMFTYMANAVIEKGTAHSCKPTNDGVHGIR
jgi:hypothetical protein